MTFTTDRAYGASIALNEYDEMRVAIQGGLQTALVEPGQVEPFFANLMSREEWLPAERAIWAATREMARAAVQGIEQIRSVTR